MCDPGDMFCILVRIQPDRVECLGLLVACDHLLQVVNLGSLNVFKHLDPLKERGNVSDAHFHPSHEL